MRHGPPGRAQLGAEVTDASSAKTLEQQLWMSQRESETLWSLMQTSPHLKFCHLSWQMVSVNTSVSHLNFTSIFLQLLGPSILFS